MLNHIHSVQTDWLIYLSIHLCKTNMKATLFTSSILLGVGTERSWASPSITMPSKGGTKPEGSDGLAPYQCTPWNFGTYRTCPDNCTFRYAEKMLAADSFCSLTLSQWLKSLRVFSDVLISQHDRKTGVWTNTTRKHRFTCYSCGSKTDIQWPTYQTPNVMGSFLELVDPLSVEVYCCRMR